MAVATLKNMQKIKTFIFVHFRSNTTLNFRHVIITNRAHAKRELLTRTQARKNANEKEIENKKKLKKEEIFGRVVLT